MGHPGGCGKGKKGEYNWRVEVRVSTGFESDRFHFLHIDLNSFFASVEQQLHPEYRGRPLAVVPTMADTTCCIAASYEAKALGIKTGTQVGEAKKICPEIVLIEGNHAESMRSTRTALRRRWSGAARWRILPRLTRWCAS